MLKELKQRHRDVARLSFEGENISSIAQRLSLTPNTVSGILRDPLCQAYIQSLQDRADDYVVDVRKKLSQMTANAVDVLNRLTTSEGVSDAVALRASQDILDRSGFKPVNRQEVVTAHLTKEDLMEMKERARRAGFLKDANPK